MRRLSIVVLVLVVVAIAVGASFAMATTNRYTGTFAFESLRDQYGAMQMPGEPEVSFEKMRFYDYLIEAKGIGDPYFIAGYIAIWVNITASDGQIYGGSGATEWSAMDDPEMESLRIVVKVKNLPPGDAVATIWVHVHNVPVGLPITQDKYQMSMLDIEVK
jgi:hypothetical protein